MLEQENEHKDFLNKKKKEDIKKNSEYENLIETLKSRLSDME